MNVETQIAALCGIVEVENAIAYVKVDPKAEGVVYGAHGLPVGMRAEAEPADTLIPNPQERKPALRWANWLGASTRRKSTSAVPVFVLSAACPPRKTTLRVVMYRRV